MCGVFVVRYCLGAGLAMVEMKTLLALFARGYTFTADNNTEWTQAIGKVPKVGGDGVCGRVIPRAIWAHF